MNLKNRKKIQGRDLDSSIDYDKTKKVPSGIFERTTSLNLVYDLWVWLCLFLSGDLKTFDLLINPFYIPQKEGRTFNKK